jgi:uncharacterized HAD superfamily protein
MNVIAQNMRILMKNRATAVLDVDGVICDFESAFCDAFGSDNRHLYKLEDRYPHLHPDLIAEWVNSEDNYLNLKPIFGGLLLIQQLKQREFDVVLMTARGKHLEAVTKSWLALYHIEPQRVIFETDKAGRINSFNQQMKTNQVTLFVDDSVSQLQQVKKLNPSITCLAWAQPWNYGYFPRLRYNDKDQVYRIEASIRLGKWDHIWDKEIEYE